MDYKVLLFNPRSAQAKHRFPMSILQIAASIQNDFSYCIVDGNLERDALNKITNYISSNPIQVIGFTVMPGPQLKQAILFTKHIKNLYPKIKIIWGGYFASNQYEVVLQSGYVDYVINGIGDYCFKELLNVLINHVEVDISTIHNLIFLKDGQLIKTKKLKLPNLEDIPQFPYHQLAKFYPINTYFGKTFLGTRTMAYHSSFGCPFKCSFCAVVPIYEAQWVGFPAKRIYHDIKYFIDKYGVNAIEFFDNNFFVSKQRVLEFCSLIKDDKISFWGEARIDTMNKYTDTELEFLKDSGCKMIFFGAESGSDSVLKKMDKGGTQTGKMIKDFTERLGRIGIIPELSFVLGLPGDSEEAVFNQIKEDINFIKEIKKINPLAEIIIYTYSPVPLKGTKLYEDIEKSGFKFPVHLEDWISPLWDKFDLRKNPLTPWLKHYMIDYIRNFETVLNAKFPTNSDFKIVGYKKWCLQVLGNIRFKLNFFAMPYEIKLLHRMWRYRQPEIFGFYAE